MGLDRVLSLLALLDGRLSSPRGTTGCNTENAVGPAVLSGSTFTVAKRKKWLRTKAWSDKSQPDAFWTARSLSARCCRELVREGGRTPAGASGVERHFGIDAQCSGIRRERKKVRKHDMARKACTGSPRTGEGLEGVAEDKVPGLRRQNKDRKGWQAPGASRSTPIQN